MADFTYRNIAVSGAETLEEAIEQVARAKWQQLNFDPDNPTEPTQAEIAEIVAQIQAEESEKQDLDSLASRIDDEIAWLGQAIVEVDTADVAGLRDILKRVLQEQRFEMGAWRRVTRRLSD